jgi:hypothetical protein
VADNVSLTTLLAKCRERGEISSHYWNDTRVTRAINDAISEMWDRILNAPGGRDFLLRPSRSLPVASRSGTGDSIAISGSICTLTDSALASVTSDVGRQLILSSWTNPGNNGAFVVTSRTATTVSYVNPDGVAETTSTGEWSLTTAMVGLPSDFGVEAKLVEVLDGTTWRPLRPFNIPERADETVVTQSERLGTEYRIIDQSVLLSPTPAWSGNIRVWYIPKPLALSTGSDTHNFFFGWDRFVVNNVCSMHSLARGELKDAEAHLARAMLALDGILSRAKSRTPSAGFIRDDYAENYYNRWPWARRR